jgi:hypothetical protein
VSATGTPAAYSEPTSAAAPRDKAIAAVASVLLIAGMAVGWLTDNPSTGDKIGLAAFLVFDLALMAGMFLWLLPRERAAGERAARTSLILGIVGVLLALVLWTGIVFPVAAGALALGLSVREVMPDSNKAMAAIILGALAQLAAFVVLLVG